MATSVASARGRAQAMEALAKSFKGAMAAVRRLRGRDTHHPGALSQAQYQVLFELRQRGALPAGELASALEVSPASATQMLDRLADGGLVERVRSDQDRRIVVSRLSDAGRLVCEQRRAAIEPLWREMLEGFTAAELETAAAVLDQLGALFERLANGPEQP